MILQDQIDGFYYTEQQCLVHLKMDPKTFDAQDFFEMNRVMTAQKVDSVSDFQTGAGLSDEQLLERNTSREELDKQAGMQTIAGAIAHRKSRLAAQKSKSERKEDK